MVITLDIERTKKVFGRLLEVLLKGEYPYLNENIFHNYLTPEGLNPSDLCGKRHAIFLFVLCFYMRGMDSVVALKAMGEIFNNFPEIFDPTYLASLSEEEGKSLIKSALSSVKALRFQVENTSYYWWADLRKLHRFWQGDPMNLVSHCHSFDALCDRIIYKEPRRSKRSEDSPTGFHGFGKKMVSMLVYNLIGAGFSLPFVKDDTFPIPADFHAVRIFLATGCIKAKTGIKNGDLVAVQDLIRDASYQCAAHFGVSMIHVADCAWTLSRELCSGRPGNNGENAKHLLGDFGKCKLCPIKEYCNFDVPAESNYSRKVINFFPRLPSLQIENPATE